MTYRERFLALAREHRAEVSIDPDPGETWRVERVLANQPDYPLAPSDRDRGYVVTGEVEPIARRIWITGWNESTDEHGYVAALHELGHIETGANTNGISNFELVMFDAGIGPTPKVIQDFEVAAWRWAIQHLNPDILSAAIERSGAGLLSYDVTSERIAELHREMREAVSPTST